MGLIGGWDGSGPAFPCAPTDGVLGSFGMSLRDYFAAKCLPSVISAFSFMEPDHGFPQPSMPTEAAVVAYAIADAMLAERAKVTP